MDPKKFHSRIFLAVFRFSITVTVTQARSLLSKLPGFNFSTRSITRRRPYRMGNLCQIFLLHLCLRATYPISLAVIYSLISHVSLSEFYTYHKRSPRPFNTSADARHSEGFEADTWYLWLFDYYCLTQSGCT